MKKKQILILILTAFTVPLRAQGVELGFRAELTGLHLSYSDGYEQFTPSVFPNVLELTFGVFPAKKIEIEARFGSATGLFIDYYQGWEYGLILKYFPIKKFYFAAGAAGHSNSDGGGHNLGGGSSESSWVGPAIGLGVRPWDNVGFELLYQGANDSQIAYNWSLNMNEPGVKKNVSWILKLGITCIWFL